jgi:hypothetical protein
VPHCPVKVTGIGVGSQPLKIEFKDVSVPKRRNGSPFIFPPDITPAAITSGEDSKTICHVPDSFPVILSAVTPISIPTAAPALLSTPSSVSVLALQANAPKPPSVTCIFFTDGAACA